MKRFFAAVLFVMIPLLRSGAEPAAPVKSVDGYVAARLEADGFPFSGLCSDAVFVRRVYIDVLGVLPTAEEVRRFLSDKSPDKRAELIDELLQRPEFADYRALQWCDLLRVKSEFPSNLWPNAVQAYHRWIRDALRSNMPYDQFARALLTTSGSNFRDPPVNFYRPFQQREPRRIVETVALVFMGMRLETADLTEMQRLGMDAFFGKIAYKKTAEWKEEIVYFDPEQTFLDPETQQPVVPVPLAGQPVLLGQFDDPRVAFADWLTAPENPWFAKAMVNRIWFSLLGRGIVHEVDDFRPDNPAWSPELLAFLENELVSGGYDVVRIYRMILNSSTYQQSSLPTAENAADEAGFSHYRVRRLDAEVLIDAICQITGTTEEYSSAIPEPFTFIPEANRSVTLADGSIKSQFLEMFGRPGRDSSLVSDRNNGLSVFQTLHLLNSSHIQNKILRGPRLRTLMESAPGNSDRVSLLFLEILSPMPTPEEQAIAQDYIASSKQVDDGFCDVAWALINSSEFVLRH